MYIHINVRNKLNYTGIDPKQKRGKLKRIKGAPRGPRFARPPRRPVI